MLKKPPAPQPVEPALPLPPIVEVPPVPPPVAALPIPQISAFPHFDEDDGTQELATDNSPPQPVTIERRDSLADLDMRLIEPPSPETGRGSPGPDSPRVKRITEIDPLALAEPKAAPQAIEEEWRSVVDPNTGKTYYWNKVTGKTTWKMPVATPPTEEKAKTEICGRCNREVETNLACTQCSKNCCFRCIVKVKSSTLGWSTRRPVCKDCLPALRDMLAEMKLNQNEESNELESFFKDTLGEPSPKVVAPSNPTAGQSLLAPISSVAVTGAGVAKELEDPTAGNEQALATVDALPQGDLMEGALNWISSATGEAIPHPGKFASSIRSGVLLCKLFDTLAPGLLKFNPAPSSVDEQKANVQIFLNACADYGMGPAMLFSPSDIGNAQQVTRTLKLLQLQHRYLQSRGIYLASQTETEHGVESGNQRLINKYQATDTTFHLMKATERKKQAQPPEFFQSEVDLRIEKENAKLEDSPYQVAGGTIVKLIERLTHPKFIDSEFIFEFMYSYRSFISSLELLGHFRHRFSAPASSEDERKIIRQRTCEVLAIWIEKASNDFEEVDMQKQFLHFLNSDIRAYDSAVANRLAKSIQQATISPFASFGKTASMITPPVIKPFGATLMSFSEKELARQLTLVEHQLYKVVEFSELIGLKWTKKPEEAPNLTSLIAHFNRVSGWVATTVIMEPKAKARAKLVAFFLHLAAEFLELNNLSGVMEVLSGLNNAAIGRLKKTWLSARKKPENVALWDKIAHLMKPEGNYKEYRQYLASLRPPCIPYIGLYLSDLTFIEDGNPDNLDSRPELINFKKFRMVSSIVKQILLYQTTQYSLMTETTIRSYIQNNLNTMTDKDLYEESLQIEPRDGAKPTIRKRSGTLSRRLRNSASPGKMKLTDAFVNTDSKELI